LPVVFGLAVAADLEAVLVAVGLAALRVEDFADVDFADVDFATADFVAGFFAWVPCAITEIPAVNSVASVRTMRIKK
jgi:hypothetical protein